MQNTTSKIITRNGQQICLKTVDELRVDSNSNTPLKFWVPAYQRGYHWLPLQVTQLLDDIREFTLSLLRQLAWRRFPERPDQRFALDEPPLPYSCMPAAYTTLGKIPPLCGFDPHSAPQKLLLGDFGAATI
ncbi:MAG TPA: hypothetical protein PLT26_15045, partial [Anaerolineaceae bacterium]|nr:hypothetical protein [Anaerolineaceae bacterium]